MGMEFVQNSGMVDEVPCGVPPSRLYIVQLKDPMRMRTWIKAIAMIGNIALASTMTTWDLGHARTSLEAPRQA